MRGASLLYDTDDQPSTSYALPLVTGSGARQRRGRHVVRRTKAQGPARKPGSHPSSHGAEEVNGNISTESAGVVPTATRGIGSSAAAPGEPGTPAARVEPPAAADQALGPSVEEEIRSLDFDVDLEDGEPFSPDGPRPLPVSQDQVAEKQVVDPRLKGSQDYDDQTPLHAQLDPLAEGLLSDAHIDELETALQEAEREVASWLQEAEGGGDLDSSDYEAILAASPGQESRSRSTTAAELGSPKTLPPITSFAREADASGKLAQSASRPPANQRDRQREQAGGERSRQQPESGAQSPSPHDGYVSASELTRRISHCRTMQQAELLLKQQGRAFNAINLSAFVFKLLQLSNGLQLNLPPGSGYQPPPQAEAAPEEYPVGAEFQGRNLRPARSAPWLEDAVSLSSRVDQDANSRKRARREQKALLRMLEGVCWLMQKHIFELDTQGVATILYCFAKLRYRNESVLGDLLHVSDAWRSLL